MILQSRLAENETSLAILRHFSHDMTLAPLTQAGLNPARDLAPRMFAVLAGWGKAALPDNNYGFIVVYVLAPIAGGSTASLFFTKFLEPLMRREKCRCT